MRPPRDGASSDRGLVRQDDAFAEYVSAYLPTLRRLALLLCQDIHRGDDLVQGAITKLYIHWDKAAAADNIDAYARAILVREFIHDRRASWARRVTLTERPPETAVPSADPDGALDVRAAVAALPPRQRAALVLRYFCDLTIEQAAQAMQCTPGTVKSQTAKALRALRLSLGPSADSETHWKLAGSPASGQPETGTQHA